MFAALFDGLMSIIFFLIFAAIVSALPLYIYWQNTHCPNCRKFFVREVIKKEQGLLQKFTGSETRHYRCKNCQAEWSKKIYID